MSENDCKCFNRPSDRHPDCPQHSKKAVASPQATEMQTRILDAAYAQQKRMGRASPQATVSTWGFSETIPVLPSATRPPCFLNGCILEKGHSGECVGAGAAQPAAGTTPHDHMCMSNAQGHSICECKCGLLKSSAAPWPSGGTTPQAERLARPLTQAEYEVEYAKLLKKYNEIMPMPRAVAPVETLTQDQRCGNCDHHTELHNIHGCTVRIQLEDGKTKVDCPCAWDNLQAGDGRK